MAARPLTPLAAAREAAGYTQESLAGTAGSSKPTS
jgi:DNA-binding XRE family transcriptional regulator